MKDKVLTPWLLRMARVLKTAETKTKCLELKECPKCKGKYATKYKYVNGFIWVCICGWNDKYDESIGRMLSRCQEEESGQGQDAH